MSRRVRTAWGRMVACRPMRVLVPLMTAVTLAFAGWLASGIVTVRSLDDPARIGLLGLPRTVLSVILFLLALSGVGRDAGRRRSGGDVAGAAGRCAAAGPAGAVAAAPAAAVAAHVDGAAGRSGWWLACVAYVYADALRTLARPVDGLIWSPTRAPLAGRRSHRPRARGCRVAHGAAASQGRRARLPGHHPEPVARRRPEDREQPPARRLRGVPPRRPPAELPAARQGRRDLLRACARTACAPRAGIRRSPATWGRSRRSSCSP